MKRYFKVAESGTSSTSDANTATQKRRSLDDSNEIIADPGLQMKIEDYDVEIRDQIRRAYLIQGPCQPRTHNFPKKSQGKDDRSFLKAWFDNFDWLEYSVQKDVAFCFYCYLVKPARTRTDNRDDAFSNGGHNNWRKAIEAFRKHGATSAHKDARLDCFDFKNQKQSVSHILTTCSKELEIAYRDRLTAVLDCIIFLLLQGLAFRGHDESSTSNDRGNFLELLSWYGKKVESVGRVLNENAPANNQMTSPMIQKELVRACAEETRKVILDEIRDGKFALLVDKSRDRSIKEQMTIVVRFVNKKGEVVERFLGVEHVSDTSSASLKASLDDLFGRHGLSLSQLRGQGYDGVSNMRGRFNGLKTLILNENPFAFYVHCFAHQLQLVVVYVAKIISPATDFFNYVSMIVNIVGASCKRRDTLLQKHHEKTVEKLENGDIFSGRGKNQEIGIVRPGETRWGSYHTTLSRLLTMWESVEEVLEAVHLDGTCEEQKANAGGLVYRMEDFEFVFILHLMIKVLGLTNDLSKALQKKDQNIVNAMDLIATVKDLLQGLREDGFDAFFEQVLSFCNSMSIIVPNMEDTISVRGRSRRRGQLITYYHHFHVEIFIAVIDSIAAEMRNRFTESSTELMRCVACLHPKNSFSRFDHGMLLRLAEIYTVDFSQTNLMFLKEQLHTYIHTVRRNSIFSSCNDLASLGVKMVENDYHLTFPLVYRLVELALILPVATTTVERAFSSMNIIKTDLRNKIGDEWLNDMMVCYIERDIFAEIDLENILQRFQNMQSCRIQFPPRSR